MIRRFDASQREDMDRVLEIWLEASIDAHDFIPRHFWEANVESMREIYLVQAETYVYETDGIIQGFLSLDEERVAALFVAPSMQGLGIGKKLLDKAKAIREKLSLTVYTENTRAVGFYEGCGLRQVAEQTDPHSGRQELIMTWNPSRL